MNDRARLQLLKQQLAASHNAVRDGEAFLFAALDASLRHSSDMEAMYADIRHRFAEMYSAHRMAEAKYSQLETKYGSLVNETHSLTVKCLDQQGEIEKACSAIEEADCKVAEVNALYSQACRKISDLENRIMELETPASDAPKNAAIPESDSVVQNPLVATIADWNQSEDEKNGINPQEANSVISLLNKNTWLCP